MSQALETTNGQVEEDASNTLRKSVFLACPTYNGWRTEGSAVSVYRYPTNGRHQVYARPSTSSLLCAGFNDAWCEALNGRKQYGLTHFAMIHADVSAEMGWVDTLTDILDEYSLDAVSAVIPIKSANRQTSTAIAIHDDPLADVHILTVDEVTQLPMVFTAADTPWPDRPLLVNTGCWVCRFTEPWIEEVCWNIADAIVLNDAINRWETRVASEDWQMSRVWHRLGLKVAATRAVAVSHFGSWAYSL